MLKISFSLRSGDPIVMGVFHQVMLIHLLFVSFVVAPIPPPDTPEKEARYLKALGLISHAFDWSEEENLPRNPAIIPYHTTSNFGYQNYTWAVGLRGKDHFGRRYYNPNGTSACMANLITPSLAMTTCSCVFSWYMFYTKQQDSSKFKPHPNRTIHDITAPFLYIHHTLHTGPSYFVGEEIRNYGIVNTPIEVRDCGRKSSELLQQFTLVVLEVETPVVIGGVEAVMPVRIFDGHRDEVITALNFTGRWSARILTYGTKRTVSNEIVIPRDRTQFLGSRIDFKNEQLSFKIIQARIHGSRRSCDAAGYNSTDVRKECWVVYPSLAFCHLLPGSPVVIHHGTTVYGIVTNEVLCPEQGDYDARPSDRGFLQVRRLAGDFDGGYLARRRGTIVNQLVDRYNTQVQQRDKKHLNALKTQPLFNQTPGEIDYDGDFVPDAVAQIHNKKYPIKSRKKRDEMLRLYPA